MKEQKCEGVTNEILNTAANRLVSADREIEELKQACANPEDSAKKIALMACVFDRQRLKYEIQMEPGQFLSAKSLGKQLTAIESVLCAVAKDAHDVKLTCIVDKIQFENDKITFDLILVHTAKGVKKSGA